MDVSYEHTMEIKKLCKMILNEKKTKNKIRNQSCRLEVFLRKGALKIYS